MPVLPRPLIIGAWALFVLLSCLLPYMNYWFNPGQPLLISIVNGLGGNAIGVFTWSIIAIQLNAEVVHMILSRRANEHDVEMAAENARKQVMAELEERIAAEERARAEAEERAKAEAEERARAEARQQQVLAWYEQVKEQLPEGMPPPPGLNGT